jgi:prepilin peptidase CpaA
MTASLILNLFPLLVIAAAISDLLTMTIPNRLSLALAAAFLVAAAVAGLAAGQVLLHLASGLLVLALGLVFFARGWMGGGNVKLAAATALWFGFGSLMDYALVASLAGGALTVAILALRRVPLPAFALGWTWLDRLHDRRSGVPYGVALAGAALAVYPTSAVWLAVQAG